MGYQTYSYWKGDGVPLGQYMAALPRISRRITYEIFSVNGSPWVPYR